MLQGASARIPVDGYWFDYVLFSFEGRLDRRRYWNWLRGIIAVGTLLVAIDMHLGSPFATVFGTLAVLPMLSLNAKRCHDVGRSGWFQFIMIIPFVGVLVLYAYLGLRAGEPSRNRFGVPGSELRGATYLEIKEGAHLSFRGFSEGPAA